MKLLARPGAGEQDAETFRAVLMPGNIGGLGGSYGGKGRDDGCCYFHI